jgi:hypothetical protein
MPCGRIPICVLSCVVFLGVASPGPLSAQGSRKGGGTAPSRSAPSVTPPTRRQPDRQPARPQVLFVSGVIVQEDGSPIPSGVVIERICGGRVTREGYPDSTGHFSFQIGGTGRSASVLPDASDESGAGADLFSGRGSQLSANSSALDRQVPTSLMGCEIRARLAGYTSTRVNIELSGPVGNLDLGTILLCRVSRVQGTLVSATDLAAPKPARKEFARFEETYGKKDLPAAERHLKTALEKYPNYAAAWFGLGQLYWDLGRPDDARAALSKAIEVDPKYVGPYVHLARIAAVQQNWESAADLSARAIELDPVAFLDAYYLNSAANYYLKRLDAAERSGKKAAQMDSLHRIPQVHLILADICQRRHDSTGAVEQLQRYLAIAPDSKQAGRVREQLKTMQEDGASPVATTQPRPE